MDHYSPKEERSSRLYPVYPLDLKMRLDGHVPTDITSSQSTSVDFVFQIYSRSENIVLQDLKVQSYFLTWFLVVLEFDLLFCVSYLRLWYHYIYNPNKMFLKSIGGIFTKLLMFMGTLFTFYTESFLYLQYLFLVHL